MRRRGSAPLIILPYTATQMYPTVYESMVCTFILVLDYVLVKLFLCAYILFFIMYNKQHRTKDLSGRRNASPAMQHKNMGVLPSNTPFSLSKTVFLTSWQKSKKRQRQATRPRSVYRYSSGERCAVSQNILRSKLFRVYRFGNGRPVPY